jgi:DNA-binding XRE family transcriptional regulator
MSRTMKIQLKDISFFNALLLRKGFNKIAFSKEIGLSQPATVQLTNGDRHPSPRTAKRVTEVLEVEFDDIFTIEKVN